MFNIYFHGALRVLIDAVSARVVAVQDRISGEAASLRYSSDYIRAAETAALRAFASLEDCA
jgi:hypothetical protein